MGYFPVGANSFAHKSFDGYCARSNLSNLPTTASCGGGQQEINNQGADISLPPGIS